MIFRTQLSQPQHAVRCRPFRAAGCERLETRALLAALTIAQENQLPGTPQSDWIVVADGDPQLQGFATDMSVNVGQTVKFKLDDGMHVVVHGRLEVYSVKGTYQLVAARVEPIGLGALQAAFEQLKKKLHGE